MPFMELETLYDEGWIRVETRDAGDYIIPGDVVGYGWDVTDRDEWRDRLTDFVTCKIVTVEREAGWSARYSAAGYMDRTDWVGIFATEEDAKAAARELYGEDSEESEEDSDDDEDE